MRLPACAEDTIVWAYPGLEQQVPCLMRVDADRMLCGRFLNPGGVHGSVPALQPYDPDPVCPRCVVELALLVGACPVCGVELVADEQGRAPQHGDCVGVNLALRRLA